MGFIDPKILFRVQTLLQKQVADFKPSAWAWRYACGWQPKGSHSTHYAAALVISINFNQRTLCGAAAKGRALHHRFAHTARRARERRRLSDSCRMRTHHDVCCRQISTQKFIKCDVIIGEAPGAWTINRRSALVPAVKNKRPSFSLFSHIARRLPRDWRMLGE